MSRTAILAIAALLAAPSAWATEAEFTTAIANIVDSQGNPAGKAELKKTDDGVMIHLEVMGLPPGTHGLTIHNAARCDGPMFLSSGKPFDPDNGAKTPPMSSLPNLVVGKDGNASANIMVIGANLNPSFTQGATTDPGPGSLIASPGTSLIVHDKPGDPAERTGRIACGIIEA